MKGWAIFFGLFLVGVIVLADTGHLGALHVVYDYPGGDKVGHFTLFGLFSFVVNLSVFEARPAADKVKLAIATSSILALAVGLEEMSQLWFPTRSADVFDWLASCAGVAAFAYLAVRVRSAAAPSAEA